MSIRKIISTEEKFECNTCTWRLVRLCYRRAPWFMLVREPLVFGMRILARLYGIDIRRGRRGHPDCRGCVRYAKNELKQKSSAFVWLNGIIDPVFNRMRNSIITQLELEEARNFARDAAEQNRCSGTDGKDN
ncbi:MAG TPA: nitroreductase [bacterium]|nr:nitroreductase [bacterium]